MKNNTDNKNRINNTDKNSAGKCAPNKGRDKNQVIYSFSYDSQSDTLTDTSKLSNNLNSDSLKNEPVKIRLEKNKRGGKTVTVIFGFDRATLLDDLCSELKKICGTGGTVKDDRIEIQGDFKVRVSDILRARGYSVKFAGG